MSAAVVELSVDEVTDRDYRAEFNAILAAHTPASGFTAPSVAADVVEYLRTNDPDLLRGWLDDCAVVIVTGVVGDRARSQRSYLAANAIKSVFADVAADVATGKRPETDLLSRPYTTSGGVILTLAEMGPKDLDYTAGEYVRQGNACMYEAAFLKAIRKKVRTGVVGDHLTSDQLAVIRGPFP